MTKLYNNTVRVIKYLYSLTMATEKSRNTWKYFVFLICAIVGYEHVSCISIVRKIYNCKFLKNDFAAVIYDTVNIFRYCWENPAVAHLANNLRSFSKMARTLI